MKKKLIFVGNDPSELRSALDLVCKVKRLYLNESEPTYFGYNVTQMHDGDAIVKTLRIRHSFYPGFPDCVTNGDYNGFSLIPMSLSFETLYRFVWDFINDTMNFPGPVSDDKAIGFKVVMGISGDEHEMFHVSCEYFDVN